MPQARSEAGCSASSLARGVQLAQVVCCDALEQHTRAEFLLAFPSIFLGPVQQNVAWFAWVSFLGPHAMLWHQRGSLMVLVRVL